MEWAVNEWFRCLWYWNFSMMYNWVQQWGSLAGCWVSMKTRDAALSWSNTCVALFLPLTAWAQPQLMASTQGRYEYMTKESPAPTLKAELEISSVLISSPGLSAQLSLWIQITPIPAFIPLQPVSAHVFYPPESSCPNSAFISVGWCPPWPLCAASRGQRVGPQSAASPGTSGEGKKAAVCILNPENIF